MATQYSLSYDADGNPSLVKNTVEGKAPVIKTDFTIGEYKPIRTVSTDNEITSTSSDTFSREKQLEICKELNIEPSDSVLFGLADKNHPEFGDYDRGTEWRRVCISKLLGDCDYVEL